MQRLHTPPIVGSSPTITTRFRDRRRDESLKVLAPGGWCDTAVDCG